jgi:mutator protein MutT
MVSLILISNKNKFLLLKRSKGEHHNSDKWGLPGGTVEKDETPMDAAIRELYEETSLKITNMRVLEKYPYNDTFINVYVYNSSEFNPYEIILNEEHTEWKMFTYYDITQLKNVIPTTVKFIMDYLNNPDH